MDKKVDTADNKVEALDASLLRIIDDVIDDARQAFKALQHEDGRWVFELEADTTIPSEYIFLNHFLGELEPEREAGLARYIRNLQAEHGGWPLYYGGDLDLSSSVKAYFALKLTGDDPDAPHMKRAREAILARGGAERSNVFTRYGLALFEQVPWRAAPVMPVELMLMPKWFPVNMERFSYWSRVVIAPLLILATLKPKAKNPTGVMISELFVTPPHDVKDYLTNPAGSRWGDAFLLLDKILRKIDPFFPKGARKKAIDKALAFTTERLNGEDGLGAIFPAMANAVMAFETLGYAKDHPDLLIAKKSIQKLLTAGGKDGPYCQPCISPVWDTALGAHALLEAGEKGNDAALEKACGWLLERQILDVKGDWAWKRPNLRPGGWAFQDWNDYYPDLDDTAVVGMMLDRADGEKYKDSIARAAEWIIGMQSRNGGWGAFDVDNTDHYLNNIPFADHGALLDPPTSDVTARCVSFLAQIGHDRDDPVIRRAADFLLDEQEEDGSWFGRWGTNYIYGTWSVLCAFNTIGFDQSHPAVKRAVEWLLSRQREDGGWGEDGASYWNDRRAECKESTPSQTAWALLALMAAGEVEQGAVKRGVDYLLKARRNGARWEEPEFTAVGFPRVFYLHYHGYASYFPIWALSRYRNLKQSNSREIAFGM